MAEVNARIGNYNDAFDQLAIVESVYLPGAHPPLIAKVYRQDKVRDVSTESAEPRNANLLFLLVCTPLFYQLSVVYDAGRP